MSCTCKWTVFYLKNYQGESLKNKYLIILHNRYTSSYKLLSSIGISENDYDSIEDFCKGDPNKFDDCGIQYGYGYAWRNLLNKINKANDKFKFFPLNAIPEDFDLYSIKQNNDILILNSEYGHRKLIPIWNPKGLYFTT